MLNIVSQIPSLCSEYNYKMSYWDSISMALYFVIMGYQFLLFFYFIFLRYRKTKKMYWLYFSCFFLFIGISRALFVVYDFLMPFYQAKVAADPFYPFTIYRWASFFGWMGAATLVGILATLLFTNEEDKKQQYIRIIAPLIVAIIGSLYLLLPPEFLLNLNYYTDFGFRDYLPEDFTVVPGFVLPNQGSVHTVLSLILLPMLNFLLPLIFFYLAAKSIGVIKKSSILNGIGFLMYYFGRSTMTIFRLFNEYLDPMIIAVVPTIIIMLGIIILAAGNLILQQ